ncbi:hypothetical protein GGF50DRAFT_120916 [Schizophyllum commune]
MVVSGSAEDPIERLLPGLCPYKMESSMSQSRIIRAGASYPYSIQTAAFCVAMTGLFGRNSGMTEIDFVRRLKIELLDMEANFHQPKRIAVRHQHIILPMLWSRKARELRAEVLHYISESPECYQWEANELSQDGPAEWGCSYACTLLFHVGADVGQARTLTLKARPLLDTVVPGNRVAFFLKSGIDPGKHDLYQRLPNNALLQISWWEPLAAPKPEINQPIHLEVHIRNWPGKRVHLIPAKATAQHAQCWFYCLNNPTTAVILWVPVLEGNWVVLANHMSVLNAKGVIAGRGTVVVRNEPTRTRALIPTGLFEPVAVRTFCPPIIVWRILCRKCYSKDPKRAYSSTAHFC